MMVGFSIGEAWSQAMAFLSAHFRMILIYVLAGVLIPAILQFAVMGGAGMQQLFSPEALMAGGDPAAVFAGLGVGFVIVSIIGNIIQSGSYFASWRHGLSNGSEEPAGAITYGLTAGVMWLLATIVLVIIGVIVIGVPMALLGGAAAMAGGSPGAGLGILAVLIPLLLLVVLLWLAARLSCTGPAMADARSINPLYGIGTSWRLTGPAQWSIFGYLIVLVIATFVLFLVIGLVAGVGMVGAMSSGGEAGAGSIITLVITSFLVGIPVALAYVAIPAGIYRTLVPNNAGDVFA
jgi:hypothetical protein